MTVSRKPPRPSTQPAPLGPDPRPATPPLAASSTPAHSAAHSTGPASPPPRPPAAGLPTAADIEGIIRRGGSPSVPLSGRAHGRHGEQRKGVLLNLPPETLERIAQLLARRPVRVSRQTWIEEAIEEKLRRDS